MSDLSQSPHKRRAFLITLVSALSAIFAAAVLYPLWRFLSPRKGAGEQEKVRVERTKIPIGGAHFFNFRGSPAVVVQPQAGAFLAFSAVCTHLGCVIKWQGDKGEFLCPCHAGRFSARGEVLSGPPPQPLPELQVEVEGEQGVVG